MAEDVFLWSRADQEMFMGMLALVEDRYGAGAPGMHLTLENGNLDDGSIAFDLKVAENGKNYLGVAVLRMLLDMPHWLRQEVWENGFSIGFDCLRAEGRVVEPKP